MSTIASLLTFDSLVYRSDLNSRILPSFVPSNIRESSRCLKSTDPSSTQAHCAYSAYTVGILFPRNPRSLQREPTDKQQFHVTNSLVSLSPLTTVARLLTYTSLSPALVDFELNICNLPERIRIESLLYIESLSDLDEETKWDHVTCHLSVFWHLTAQYMRPCLTSLFLLHFASTTVSQRIHTAGPSVIKQPTEFPTMPNFATGENEPSS
mmetsp:Transcript_22456/g.33495  ORF Transcript_22456/g.33495 Transcript_22456/m.33495 type:complete len:210 (-) Transcript_22456:288-917(-)